MLGFLAWLDDTQLSHFVAETTWAYPALETMHTVGMALKPEMFTSVTIYTEEGDSSPAVPRSAVIYEADKARVWVARTDKTIEVREVKTGITSGDSIQILQGLHPGEMVVTKGSLFVDQAAGS